MKLQILSVLVSCILLAASGCKDDHRTETDGTFAGLLSQASGDTYTVVKVHTKTDGYSVFQDQKTGAYVAYNIDKFDPLTMTSLSQYLAVATSATDVVLGIAQKEIDTYHEGYYDTYINSQGQEENGAWNPPYWTSEIVYQGGGFTFENTRASAKDLEKVISNASKADATAMQAALTAEYGFSEDRASQVASLTKQLKEIAGTRELTDADKSSFTQAALGVDYPTLQNSLQKSDNGDAAAYRAILQKAAKVNGTTPEQSRQLLEDMADFDLKSLP